MTLLFLLKKRAGEGMGGLGGKGNTSRASSDRRRPQAVPVATKEATGIDSRDEGFPFPPDNLPIVLTGPGQENKRHGAAVAVSGDSRPRETEKKMTGAANGTKFCGNAPAY